MMFTDRGVTEIVGAGELSVEHCDRIVIDAVLDYLGEEHDKLQFIPVRTYGSHFPYTTNEKLYRKYYERVMIPKRFDQQEIPSYLLKNKVLAGHMKEERVTGRVARGYPAAYCGQTGIVGG